MYFSIYKETVLQTNYSVKCCDHRQKNLVEKSIYLTMRIYSSQNNFTEIFIFNITLMIRHISGTRNCRIIIHNSNFI